MNCILDTSIRYLKGVGEEREKLFAKLGIQTLRDLAGFFPRAYEDRTVFKKIDSLVIGESVCVRAMAAAKPTLSHIRKGLDLVKLRAVDETGSIEITFFNAPFIKDAIKQGEDYVFYGKVSGTLLRLEMINPVFERFSESGHGEHKHGTSTGCIVPIYPLTAKLTQKTVSNAARAALLKCGDMLPDVLPSGIAAEYELCKARFAYHNIHFPESFKDLDIAKRRLIFEELFVLVTAMKLMRSKRGEKTGKTLQSVDFSEFTKTLPYTPTKAQLRAIGDAAGDMSSGKLMNRLVQGDVGSGKTLVAAACAWMAWRSKGQTAFMAPTEILAKQHLRSLTDLLEPMGMRVGLLVGSMTAKSKRETYEKLRLGEIDLIIGTHALISEGVEFKNLALVITDEQHRFGVEQRTQLKEKGDSSHVLVMSATPIPRTLALIIYGDLDISIIDEMPPGRREIETHIVTEAHRERVYGFVRKLVGEGRQVFIVCPMVEEAGEDSDNEPSIKSVKEYHENLTKEIFPDLNVSLVHGKMPAKTKDAAMVDFASGKAHVLVATTVVEVGVDVPNAALMLVENADRFGLSQLHQLRGRVGRGEHKSYCVLFQTQSAHLKDTTSCEDVRIAAVGPPLAGVGGYPHTFADDRHRKTIPLNVTREPSPCHPRHTRLKVMKSTNDGFKIAEEDLKLRGPGDFFGSRQHGLPKMRIANLMTDMQVLHQAQKAAGELLRKDPLLSEPEHRELAEQIERMFQGGELS